MADDNVPGIDDVPRLGRWLHENGITPTAVPPRVRLIAGGRSNLTYLLDPRATDGPGAPLLVLRRFGVRLDEAADRPSDAAIKRWA